MKYFILFVLTLNFVFCQKSNDIVAEESVSETLKFLSSDNAKGRKPNTPEMEKVMVYLENIFEKNTVKPFFKSYRDTLTTDNSMHNIVGYIEGSDNLLKKEFVIMGAHYDHIGFQADGEDKVFNGANDNASGTTAVAEMIRYFSKNKPKRSIIFAFFTAEEIGLKGSYHLAEKLKKENLNLYFMFNFEMIGVPMQDVDHQLYITGYNVSNMADVLNEKAERKVIGYLPEELKYQLFRRSDNFPFYKEFKVPAQTVSTFDFKNYDFYHDLDDEFEKMDIKHITKTINIMIPILEKAINEPKKMIRLNDK